MEFGLNKTNEQVADKKGGAFSLFYIFVFFMFVLAPTSSGGILPSVDQIVVSWSILLVTILVCIIFFSRTDFSQFVLVTILFGMLTIFTIVSSHYDPTARFSIARLAPISSFLLVTFVTLKSRVAVRNVKIMLHIFMAVFLIWNLLIIFEFPFIKEFTISNYTQLYERATSNMFIKKRPIMSFGIYTFASFFYFLFFIICRRLYILSKKNIYLLYQVFLLIANVLLVSNTAFVFSLLMAYFIFKGLKSTGLRVLLVIGIIGFAFLVVSNLELSGYYLESFGSEKNGFRGRYTDSGTLEANLDYLDNFFFIGFNIVEGLTYSDSGYLVYYTMGSILFVIGMYYSLFRFYRNNIPMDFLIILIPTLVFEIALPVIIYYKFIYAIIFFMISYRSLDTLKKIES